MPKTKSKLPKIYWSDVKPYIFPGLAFLLIVVSSWLLVRPQLERVIDLHRELKNQEKKMTQLANKVAFLESLDQYQLSTRVKLTNQAIPNEKNLPLCLGIVGQLAREDQIELLVLQVKPGDIATASGEKSKKDLTWLVFDLLVSGRDQSFERFLDDLVGVAPLIRVENFSLTFKSSQQVDAHLRISTPILPLPTTLGAIEKPLSPLSKTEEAIFGKIKELDYSYYQVQETFREVPSGRSDIFSF